MILNQTCFANQTHRKSYLSKETSSKHIRNPDLKLKKSNFLSKIDSNRSILNNPKISDSLNSSILKLKLKPPGYKRAESELKQILEKSISSREKSDSLLKSKSINRNSYLSKFRKSFGKFDSSLNTKEASLILDEYRNIHRPEI